jgi:hypothetical protein
MSKHKWHKEIKAWADGAEIEFKVENAWWDAGNPEWNEDGEYRIKQQPKERISAKELIKQVVDEYNASCDKEPQYLYVYTAGNSVLQGFGKLRPDLDWDYIGKIKLEVDDD